jgi:hypothetical protein
MQNITRVKMLQYQCGYLVHFHNFSKVVKTVIISCLLIALQGVAIRLSKESGLYNEGQVSKSKYKECKL